MAAVNFYAGFKREAQNNPNLVVAGTSSAGAAVDVEVRMQIDNGSALTGLTRKDVVVLLDQMKTYVLSNGGPTAGAFLPVR